MLRYSQTFTPNKSVPDFAVTVLNCPEVRCPDIKACSDLDDIFKNIDELPVTVSKNGTKFWEKSQVFRAGQNLGSLDWMKSSFHVWKELKDCEGVESRIWKVLKVCEEMGE